MVSQYSNSTLKKFSQYIFIVLVLYGPLVFFVSQVLNNSNETQKQQISLQLNLDSRFLSEQMDRNVEELITELELIPFFGQDLQQVRTDLNYLIKRMPAITHVNFFSADGNVKYSSSSVKLQWQTNLLTKKWYRQLIRTWEPIISPIYQSPISPFPRVISLAVPISLNDKIEGFWLVYLDVEKMDPLFPMIRNTEQEKYTVWFDGEGKIVKTNLKGTEKSNKKVIFDQRWWYQINKVDKEGTEQVELLFKEKTRSITYSYGKNNSRFSEFQALVIQNSVHAVSGFKSLQSDLIILAVMMEIIFLIIIAILFSQWQKKKSHYALIETQAMDLQAANDLLATKTEDLIMTNKNLDQLASQLAERKDDLLMLNNHLSRLHKYLNFLTVPVVAIDEDFRVEFVNRAAESELGLVSTKTKGKPFHNFLHLEDSAGLLKMLPQLKENQKRIEYELGLKVGEQKKQYLLAGDYLMLKDWQGYIMTFTDLTDLLNLQNNIKEKNLFLDTSAHLMQAFLHIGSGKQVLKSTLDAIKSFAHADSVYCYQANGEKLFLKEHVSGKNKISPVDLPIKSSMAGSTLLNGQAMIIEEKKALPLNYQPVENKWRFKSAIFRPLVINREAKGVLLILDPSKDMIENYEKNLSQLLINFEIGFSALLTHEELEEKNTELEKSASYRAQLLRSTTHGLNTPLSTIKGYLRLINLNCRSSIEKYPELNKYLIKLDLATEDMEEKVKIYLDIARINRDGLILETSQMRLNHFLEPLKQLLDKEATSRTVKLFTQEEFDNNKMINTDRKRFHFALKTVLLNALRFVPENDEVQLNLVTDNGNLEITFEDHGPVIKKAHIPLIGSEFLSTGYDSERIHYGNHMAMALAVKLLRLVKGELEVTSNKSRTIHKITLPLSIQDKNET